MFVLSTFALSGLVPDIQSDSAELEEESSPRKLLFCFIEDPIVFASKLG